MDSASNYVDTKIKQGSNYVNTADIVKDPKAYAKKTSDNLHALGEIVTHPKEVFNNTKNAISNFGKEVKADPYKKGNLEGRAAVVVASFLVGAGEVSAASKAANTAVKVEQTASKITASKITTPYGDALQSTTKDALNVKSSVDSGGELYRSGTFGRSNVEDAQFWAPESPFNPGFAERYGVDFSKVDYVIGGKVKDGSTFITRPAPGLGSNVGGSIEAVTNPNSVRLDFFHMP